MTVKIHWLPRRSAAAATLTSLLMVVPVLAATDAQALGNNRVVTRSCGSNHVSSGGVGSGSWAQTRKASGTCAGRLSAALEMSNGYWTARRYGNNSEAYTTYPERGVHGLHWGCDDCNVTRS